MYLYEAVHVPVGIFSLLFILNIPYRMIQMKTWLLTVCMILSSVSPLSAQLPPDKAYVQVGSDGHLYLDGKRIRFWGAIGKVPADTYEANLSLVKRVKSLGFNMFRFGIPLDRKSVV